MGIMNDPLRYVAEAEAARSQAEAEAEQLRGQLAQALDDAAAAVEELEAIKVQLHEANEELADVRRAGATTLATATAINARLRVQLLAALGRPDDGGRTPLDELVSDLTRQRDKARRKARQGREAERTLEEVLAHILHEPVTKRGQRIIEAAHRSQQWDL